MEIQIDTVDRAGSFIGSLFVQGENLAVLLLQQGLASIHEFSASESQYATQLYEAERQAREQRKGIWLDYHEETAAAEDQPPAAAGENVVVEPRREYIDLVVSEYISATRFYVQIVNDDVRKLEDLMSELSKYHDSPGVSQAAHKPRVGDTVSAKFTEDNSWYRAKIRRVSGDSVDVFYIDYGNVREAEKEKGGIQSMLIEAVTV